MRVEGPSTGSTSWQAIGGQMPWPRAVAGYSYVLPSSRPG